MLVKGFNTLFAQVLAAGPDLGRGQIVTVFLASDNDDAKLNLELSMRAYGSILFPSNAPDTGGAHGQESGQGRSGSGY